MGHVRTVGYVLFFLALAASPFAAYFGADRGIDGLLAAVLIFITACVVVLNSRVLWGTAAGVILGGILEGSSKSPNDALIILPILGTMIGGVIEALRENNSASPEGDSKDKDTRDAESP